MAAAIEAASTSRLLAPPNPWVGATLVTADGAVFTGSTQRPGSNHAERQVLDEAGAAASGATLFTTLEPCDHTGRTGPCTEAIIEAGVARVVIGVLDPDVNVAGQGVARLVAAGITTEVGIEADAIEEQLAPYLHHRRTGRPYVVVKLAATLDGRTAAADGTSQWITGDAARADAHVIRAQSDAILAGAGTVRADDPALTVRGVLASDGEAPREPVRIVLGTAPEGAKIHPCLEMSGDLETILDQLGSDGIVQLMVEGGAMVAGAFHRAGLVDRYVVYFAPALMGGNDGTPLFNGPGIASIGDLTRGRIVAVTHLDPDLRIDISFSATNIPAPNNPVPKA